MMPSRVGPRRQKTLVCQRQIEVIAPNRGLTVARLVTDELGDRPHIAWLGASTYVRGETVSEALARVDAMVMAAESERVPVRITEPSARKVLLAIAQWRTLIETALETGHVRLARYPVITAQGEVIHEEGMLRLIESSGHELTAREFIPPSIRCARVSDLDLKAVELALQALHDGTPKVAVNLSMASITRPIFLRQLATLLARYQATSARLSLEVREPPFAGLENSSLRPLVTTLAGTGVKSGIDHFGNQLSLLPLLSQAGISYIKLAPFIAERADTTPAIQNFVELLTAWAQRAGVTVLAAGVDTTSQWAALQRLGVAGYTGPAATSWLQNKALDPQPV